MARMTDAAVAVRRPSPVRVGTVVWLASELMFFGGLFAAYFTLRSGSDTWPPSGTHLDTLRAAAFTAVLVASSLTMHRAVRGAERGDLRALRRWLAATVVLGVVFLANQALEWRANDFAISSSPYGSIYYLTTGFHGLHVIGGLAAMIVLALRSVFDRLDAAQESAVAVVGYYWHFVDVVWIALFLTLFVVR
jgi:cytochrome c oxidase subunit 3